MLTTIATRAGLATGHKLVWLSVLEDNAAAVALYRSLGFEPDVQRGRAGSRPPASRAFARAQRRLTWRGRDLSQL